MIFYNNQSIIIEFLLRSSNENEISCQISEFYLIFTSHAANVIYKYNKCQQNPFL